MHKDPCVYIMANKPHGTLYVGVTSSLQARVWQHKNHVVAGFTSRHSLERLVWFERHLQMEQAILREKQLKGGSRKRKVTLIESLNPRWDDLYDSLFD